MLLYKILLFSLFLFAQCDGKPAKYSQAKALSFLSKYGFLAPQPPPTKVEAVTLPDPAIFTNAIKKFQQYFHLSQSGKLDHSTVELMQQKRCGLPDITTKTKNPPNTFRQWSSGTILQMSQPIRRNVYSYYVQKETLPMGMKLDMVYAALEYSFNMWAAVTNVLFVRGETIQYPDIYVGFYSGSHNDTSPFDGRGKEIVAHSASVTLPKSIRPSGTFSYIHFDKDEVWVINQTSEYHFLVPTNKQNGGVDFIMTAIHEAGHILGLDHTNSSASSVMNAYLPSLTGGEYLLKDVDIKRIKASYGRCEPERIEAIFSSFDGRTYIIIGPYTYLFNDYKLEVEQSWPRFSEDIFGVPNRIKEGILHSDGQLYLFTEDHYHTNNVNKDGSQYVVQITTSQMWSGMVNTTIDAAFVHTDNSTYLFQRNQVYKWDSSSGRSSKQLPAGKIATGWPKLIKTAFPGVPDNIDTAFRWTYDGKVYFFKDKYFYIWDPVLNKADGAYETWQWKNLCNVVKCGKQNMNCLRW